jgi:alpha-mannosidase
LTRELVDQKAPHTLNEPVVRWTKNYRQEHPVDVRIAKGAVGPVYASQMVTSQLPGCPRITQEIILYEDLKRIDFNNRILKDSTSHMELYFAFPFRVDNPRFRFEASDSVIRPFEDQFPGSNTNYYSVQHWADVSDGRFSITLAPIESHLLMFGGMWPLRVSQAHHGVTNPQFAEPFVTSDAVTRGHMYSLAMVSGFRTNFQATQQGDMLFRYSITTHDGQWPEGRSAHFGWGMGNPLIPLGTTSLYKGPLPTTQSFCQIDQPNVILMTFKEAEDNHDLVLRLVETEGERAEVTITLPGIWIERAYRTNIVEGNQDALSATEHQIRVPVKPFGIASIRVAHAKPPG